MLRVHFTAEDLVRTRLSTNVDPLWEMVFSRVRLTERHKAALFVPWVRRTAAAVELAPVRAGLRVLRALTPLGPYFPDFLTPAEGEHGLTAALEAIRVTPARRLRHEMALLARSAILPRWAAGLAKGETGALGGIVHTLAGYHRAVIEPHAETMRAAVEAAERAHRARAVLDQGIEGLLSSMAPLASWRPPVLEVRYPHDRDLHLAGRGLRLVPSYFCRHTPVALADPGLTPILAYPINHAHSWTSTLDQGGRPDEALAALLGGNRAAVLAAIDAGATTGELARRLGLPASSVSRHTAVLREAGMIVTERHSQQVLHTVTPLGAAVLRGRS